MGVLWMRFLGGTITSFHFSEGTKAVFPWDRVYLYPIRLQRIDHTITSLTREGLPLVLETTVTFVIAPSSAPELHISVGPEYAARLIEPLIAASVRERIADSPPEQLYAVAHRAIEDDIAAGLQQKLTAVHVNHGSTGSPLIVISDFSVRSITLPPIVRQSIEEKLAADQAVRRYRFSIDQERLEAQRREIEAQGIRRFQEIVSPAISDSFLRWRGIEATVALSQSPNSKIVVIGNGGSGLPLILDGRGDSAPPAASPPMSDAAPALQPAAPVGAQPSAAPAGAPHAPQPQPDLPSSGDIRVLRQPLTPHNDFTGHSPQEAAIRPGAMAGAPGATEPDSGGALPEPPRGRLLAPSERAAALGGIVGPMSRDMPGFRGGAFDMRPGLPAPRPSRAELDGKAR
ncbi:prohibitin family protein [Pseudoroseomonas wenyumeiae]